MKKTGKNNVLQTALKMVIAVFTLACSPPSSTPSGPSYQEVTLPAAGGTIVTRDGITISVPENAVAADVRIRIRRVSSAEALGTLSPLGTEESKILFCFDALPSGQSFLKPVAFSISGLSGLDGWIPLAHMLDLGAKTYLPSDAVTLWEPATGTLSIMVNHFTSYAAVAAEGLPAGECADTPCRCGTIQVVQSDIDLNCETGACQMLTSTVTVNFLDCGTSESATLVEMSPACAPRLQLEPAAAEIEPGASTALTAALTLGCGPFSGQTIFLDSASLGTVSPSSQTSDDSGRASFTFTAGEASGRASINVAADVSWNAYSITAGGETYTGPRITRRVTAQAAVTISGLYELDVFASEPSIPPGFVTTIQCAVLDPGLVPVENQPVTLSVSGNGSLAATGLNTGPTGAQAATDFTAGGSEGTVVVFATAVVNRSGLDPVTLTKNLTIEVKRRRVQHWQGTLTVTDSQTTDFDNYIAKTTLVSMDIYFDPNVADAQWPANSISNVTGTAQVSNACTYENGPPMGDYCAPYWISVSTLNPSFGIRGYGNQMIRADGSSRSSFSFTLTDTDGTWPHAEKIISAEDCMECCYPEIGCDRETKSYDWFFSLNLCPGTTEPCESGGLLFIDFWGIDDSVRTLTKSGTSRFDDFYGTFTLELHRVD